MSRRQNHREKRRNGNYCHYASEGCDTADISITVAEPLPPNDGEYCWDEAVKMDLQNFCDETFAQSWIAFINYDYEETSSEVVIDMQLNCLENNESKNTAHIRIEKSSLLVVIRDRLITWVLSIPRLSQEINDKESSYEIKKDNIIVRLRKVKPWIWSSLHYTHPNVTRNFKRKILDLLVPSKPNHSHQPIEEFLSMIKGPVEKLGSGTLDVSTISSYFGVNLPSITMSLSEIKDFLESRITENGNSLDKHFMFLAVIIYMEERRAYHSSQSAKTKDSGEKLSKEQRKAQQAKEDGNAHFKAKRYHKAIEAYSRAIALDPRSPVYYVNRCITYFNMAMPMKALDDGFTALKLERYYAKAYLYIGKCFYSLSFTSRAKHCVIAARMLNPELTGLDEELTKINEVQCDFKAIVDAALSNDDPKLLRHIEAISRATGEKIMIIRKVVEDLCINGLEDKARNVTSTFYKWCPAEMSRDMCYLSGIIAYYKDKEATVHECFTRYLKSMPENVHARKRYMTIKNIYRLRNEANDAADKGQFEGAIVSYKSCLDFFERTSQAKRIRASLCYKLAVVEAKVGKAEEAMEHINQAIDHCSECHEALAQRGEWLLQMGRRRKGTEDIKKAQKLSPESGYEKLLESVRKKDAGAKVTPAPQDEVDTLKKSQAESNKNQGNQCYKEGNYKEAVTLYTEAIALYPKNAVYYSNRSICHIMLKHFEDGLKDAESALEIDPTYIKALVRRAKALIALGDAENAVDSLEKASKMRPNDPDLNFEKEKAKTFMNAVVSGNASFLAEDFVTAERYFSEALKFAESCVDLLLKEIRCLIQLDRFVEALTLINSALVCNPGNAVLYYLKALCLYDEINELEVIDLLQKSIAIDSNQTEVSETLESVENVYKLLNGGKKAYSEGRQEDALALYRKGLEEKYINNRVKAVISSHIGSIHKMRSEYEKAICAYTVSISFKPDNTEAYEGRAECYFKENKLQNVVEDYEALVTLSPSLKHRIMLKEAKQMCKSQSFSDDYELEKKFAQNRKRAEEFMAQGNFEKAVEHFIEALSLKSDDPSCFLSRSQCMLQLKRYNDAILDAEKVVTEDPLCSEGYLQIGKCFFVVGDSPKAMSAFERVKELNPSCKETVEGIAKHYAIKKKLEKANESIRTKLFVTVSQYLRNASKIATSDLSSQMSLLKTNDITKLPMIINSLEEEMGESSGLSCLKGVCSYYQDDRENALTHLKNSLNADPSNKEAIYWKEHIQTVYDLKEKGNEAFLKQEYSEAHEWYKEALQLEDDNFIVRSTLHCNVGMLLMKQKKFLGASGALSAALLYRQDYLKALEKRAQCYKKQREYYRLASEDYHKLFNLTKSDDHLRQLKDVLRRMLEDEEIDYYEILEVPHDASNKDLRNSFKRLARECHPDILHTEADLIVGEIKFKQINEAYSTLIDPRKRERYDRGEIKDKERDSEDESENIHEIMANLYMQERSRQLRNKSKGWMK